ncbi:MAG: c-type cytochrome [Vulcanimicrobiaceae bacterium]
MTRSSAPYRLFTLLAAGIILALAAVPALSKSTSATNSISFSAAQAAAGKKQFEAHCASCHGEQLEGGVGPALAGPNAATLRTKLHATVSDVFSIMAMEMPFYAPASLTHDQYVEIMAYVLEKNGYKPGSQPLTYSVAMNSKAPIAPK